MRIFSIFLSAAIILLLIIGSFHFMPSNASAESRSSSYEIVCNWMYAEEVGDAIDEAKHTIYVAMYLVVVGDTVDWLIDKLVDADERGVEVRILIDNEPEPHTDYSYSYIEERGLNVKMDNSDKMSHSKLIIIDNTTVFIGSTNWTDNSIENNNEANAKIIDNRVAAYLERYFWSAWKDTTNDFDLGIENYNGVTPLIDRDYFPNVRDAIDAATERIYILHYAFKLSGYDDSLSDKLFDAIVNASQRGVDVRVVLEYSDWEDYINEMNQYTINKFKSHGINASFENDWQITHSKLIIVDDSTILGSTNWAYSGLNVHHNADILIRNRVFTEDMIDFYSALWFDDEYKPPNEIVIYRQVARDQLNRGGLLEVSGYVDLNQERFSGAEVEFWMEDGAGGMAVEKNRVITDQEGRYDLSMKVPLQEGTYTLRLRVSYDGVENTEEKEITVKGGSGIGRRSEENDLLKILIIAGVFVLVAVVLMFVIIRKKE